MDPGLWDDVSVWIPELSAAEGSTQVTVAEDSPFTVYPKMSLGKSEIFGFSLSNVQKEDL